MAKHTKAQALLHDDSVDIETRSTHEDHEDLRLWLRLLSCSTRIEKELRIRLREEYNFTLPRFDMMAQLERNPQGLRMAAFSERLMVTCGNITGLTNQLEREGLLVRTADPEDGRATIVNLTSFGLKKFRMIARSHEQWIIELLGGMTKDEKQRMFAMLRKLKIHLSSSIRKRDSAFSRVRP